MFFSQTELHVVSMAVHIEEKTPSILNLRSYDFFQSNLLVIIVGKRS